MRRFWQEFDFATEAIKVFLELAAIAALIMYAR